jgi:hypothetical protein
LSAVALSYLVIELLIAFLRHANGPYTPHSDPAMGVVIVWFFIVCPVSAVLGGLIGALLLRD